MTARIDLTRRPIRLAANPVHRFYEGGRLWRGFRGIARAVDTRWAEDWVASTIDAGDRAPDGSLQGRSWVDGAVSLAELIAAHPIEMLGEPSLRRWGLDPMVQVKLVSPRARVPLHIHPDSAFAASNLHSAHGKAEAWIVLEAPGTSEGPATFGVGLRDDVSPAAFRAAVLQQDREAMLGAVHVAPLSAGDVVYIAPGVPHFISGGTFFVEIQEPADLGFLLEWRGFVDDEQAASSGLGMGLALAALDDRGQPRESAIGRAVQAPALIRSSTASAETHLFDPASAAPFEGTWLDVATSDEPEVGRYHVVVVTAGRGVIEGPFGREAILPGETFVMPATLVHRYVSDGDAPLRLLRCFGPKP